MPAASPEVRDGGGPAAEHEHPAAARPRGRVRRAVRWVARTALDKVIGVVVPWAIAGLLAVIAGTGLVAVVRHEPPKSGASRKDLVPIGKPASGRLVRAQLLGTTCDPAEIARVAPRAPKPAKGMLCMVSLRVTNVTNRRLKQPVTEVSILGVGGELLEHERGHGGLDTLDLLPGDHGDVVALTIVPETFLLAAVRLREAGAGGQQLVLQLAPSDSPRSRLPKVFGAKSAEARRRVEEAGYVVSVVRRCTTVVGVDRVRRVYARMANGGGVLVEDGPGVKVSPVPAYVAVVELQVSKGRC